MIIRGEYVEPEPISPDGRGERERIAQIEEDTRTTVEYEREALEELAAEERGAAEYGAQVGIDYVLYLIRTQIVGAAAARFVPVSVSVVGWDRDTARLLRALPTDGDGAIDAAGRLWIGRRAYDVYPVVCGQLVTDGRPPANGDQADDEPAPTASDAVSLTAEPTPRRTPARRAHANERPAR